jgi:hypothetical protein
MAQGAEHPVHQRLLDAGPTMEVVYAGDSTHGQTPAGSLSGISALIATKRAAIMESS